MTTRTQEDKNNQTKTTDTEKLKIIWQGRQDLNLRHPVLETGALPTELLP